MRAEIRLRQYVISGGSQNIVDYVTDYLGPLFEKQTALACNPDLIKTPPSSYDELRAFVERLLKADVLASVGK